MSEISAAYAVCMIIGDPVSHSLSPRMHNAGYSALGLQFVMIAAPVQASHLPAAIAGMRALNVRGAAVTMPHKNAAIALVDELDGTAREIGALNTIVNIGGILKGFNTDWIGVREPLVRSGSLKGKSVAVLGAGGAAQAAAYAAHHLGAQVSSFNRTPSRAQATMDRWCSQVFSLDDHKRLLDYDVIINTTPVGMGVLSDQSPIPITCLRSHQIVFETIYAPEETRLVKDAQQAGATIIRGKEMFLEQGLAQFQLHTGTTAPRAAMQEVLLAAS